MKSKERSLARKAYFNEAAKNWDEKFCTAELATRLERLVPRFGLKAGQNVLDVGTGTGVLIPFLLNIIGSSGSITAIDYAENMIEGFKSKFSHLQNVTAKISDVEDLDLPTESFDAAICFGLFPHLDCKEKALSHLNRVLKKGGKLIIAHALSSADIKEHHIGEPSVAQDVLPEEAAMRQLLEAGFAVNRITDERGSYLCIATKS